MKGHTASRPDHSCGKRLGTSVSLAIIWATIVVTTCCWDVGRGFGQETPEEAAVGQDRDTGTRDDVIREQTIYIPYEKLRDKFEKEGRGVFLPYEKFQQLWNAARERVQPDEPVERPVKALINSIQSEATIGEQVVDVSAVLELEILGEGWVKIPLRLRHSAIRSATINDQAARIIFDESVGHQLLYKKSSSEEPEAITLTLRYTRQFDKTPGQSSVAFEAPRAPLNRWRVRVPEAGTDVKIEPMIAATREPGQETGDAAEDGAGEPRQRDLLAFVGAAPSVRITWTPKAEGASGLAAFATVKAEHQLVVSEGVARSTVTFDYDISRSTLSELTLEVPPDPKVVNVFDRNVKRWRVEKEDSKQIIQVELFEATRGKQSLLLELEEFSDATSSSYEVKAPLVKAVGVGRQQGIVVARVEEGLQGEAVKRTGLLQLDQNDLPRSLQDSSWTFAYRYGAVPYDLTLRVEKVLPRISVTELVDAELVPDRLTVHWQGLFQIADAGLFQLRLKIPSDFEVRAIQGQAIGDARPVAVDSYHQADDDPTTWTVNLSQKAFGEVGLHVRLQRSLNDPNLLSPTGNASTIPIPLPRAHPPDVEFSQGFLVLSAPTSLRVNPGDTQGLRSVSFSEAYQTISAVQRGDQQARPVLSYAFAKGETRFSATAERREPQVTVDQLARATIDSGIIKFDVSFFHDIKYSGVKSVRIDIPSSLSNKIRNTNNAIRREEIRPQPDDVAEDYTAWSLAAEKELLGSFQVNLVWEQKIDELGIGESEDIPIPRLIPRNVDVATGQIVIGKAESIDVQPAAGWEGLIPIDPHNDLRHEVNVENAAMAFTFVGDWSLRVRATRYELEPSKLTSIERAVIRVVALSQDKLSVQAIYRIRSARQRLSFRLPPGAVFDAQPLRINGKSITAERESDKTISAPLLEQDIDKTFVLELRYTTPGTPRQLDLPSLPDDPAVQKVYLCVHLPVKQAVVASWGPWTEEGGGTGFSLFDVSPRPRDGELIKWVTENHPAAANSAQTFPTGKSRPFLYSTLRPQDAPEGSLHLATTDRRLFNGIVIVIVALVGLPLFRKPARLQLILLLMLTAALLLIGVFLPALARSIFASIFPVAIALLLLIWVMGHVSRWRWRRAAPASATSSSSPPVADADAISEEAGTSAEAPAQTETDEPEEEPSPPESGEDSDVEGEDRSSEEGGRRDG
ncbi:MAG: hypothetical protein R6U98_28415 [Pirellulaceae bacterium]